MTNLINQNQQVRAGIVSPPSLYTRQIGLALSMVAGAGFQFRSTPAIGQDVWLWSVTLRFRDRTLNPANLNRFVFKTGTGAGLSATNFSSWDDIMPIYHLDGSIIDWQFNDGIDETTWHMARAYSGKKRRFGVAFDRTGAGSIVASVAFNFSEG